MCQKCCEFSERVNSHGKKLRKGATPKCERVKLLKKGVNKRNEGRINL